MWQFVVINSMSECGAFRVMSSVLIILLIITVTQAKTKNCSLVFSQDITNGKYLTNRVIITYEPGLVQGSICEIKPCIRKCCPRGQAMVNNTCTTYDNKFSLDVYNGTNPIPVKDDYFDYIYNRNCSQGSYRLFPLNYSADYFYVQYDGKLYKPNATDEKERISGPEEYCMDLFIDGEIKVISGLVCFSEEQREVKNTLFSYGLFVLMPCLLVTFLVYAFLPERNIHAKSLMHYLITLFGSLLILTFTQLYPEHTDCTCKVLGLSFLFLNLVAFFWMNVMCIDIWRTFRDLRGVSRIRKKSEQRRFILYCGYAWGTPLLYTSIITSVILNDSLTPDAWYNPSMAAGECWFRAGVPSLLYYHVPLTLLIISNFTLFCLTARNIKQVVQDTAVLRQGQGRKHTYENEKQRFNLDLKLMLVMGVNRIINWLVAIIAWVVHWQTGRVPTVVWYLDDVFDALYGVFVFVIFVLNRDIWKLLKQRFYKIRGIAQLERAQIFGSIRTTTTNL